MKSEGYRDAELDKTVVIYVKLCEPENGDGIVAQRMNEREPTIYDETTSI